MASDASTSRINKSCDACTSRKVRCTGAPGPCTNCVRRKADCIFSVRKLGRKANITKHFMASGHDAKSTDGSNNAPQTCTVSVLDFATPPSPKPAQPAPSDANPTPPSAKPDPGRTGPHRIAELYVDRVLERAGEESTSARPGSSKRKFVKGNGIFGGENSLTFFSDGRLKSLSQCLGNDKVRDLVARISDTVKGHQRTVAKLNSMATSQIQSPPCLQDKTLVTRYISAYFERIHPRFPFLDRAAFEATAATQDLPNLVPRSKSWTSLYHSVLALGSQYEGGGTFEPGVGESWALFSVALANFSELMMLPDSLTTLQALTAMTLFSLGMSGMGIDQVIMAEAVRRAQNLADARFNVHATQAYRKTFWMLYGLEKVTSFHLGKSSGFVDCDIACPIPATPESNFGGFNWFLSFVRHARLLSRAYTSLFSVGVSDNPDEYYLDIIAQLTEELEDWRALIPDNGYKPGGVIKPNAVTSSPQAQCVAIVIHYFYNSFLQTISRMALRHLPSSHVEERETALQTVERTSRSVLELTSLLDVAPYTPMWMLAGIPVSGFFVLFDLVIHNPRGPHTSSNLALLDVVAGHSSRLEYVSNGLIPGSLIGEFAHIARGHVQEVNSRTPTGDTPQPCSSASLDLLSQPHWSLPPQMASPMIVTDEFSDMNLAGESGAASLAEPMDIEGFPMASAGVMGTDVMNLFGYWMPDLDPMLYQGQAAQSDLLQADTSPGERTAPKQT